MINKILKVNNLSKYFGALAAVDNLSFEVEKGEIYGIAGPNGSGKTTLINSITKVLQPNGGEIFLDDTPIHNLTQDQICRLGIARIFQDPKVFSSFSVLENVNLGKVFGGKDKDIGLGVNEIIDFVGLSDQKNKLAEKLIVSDKKKLMIAIALATSPKLLLLDEPCAGLNVIESDNVIQLIKKINDEKNISVILVEHNMKILMSISDKVLILDEGKKLCEGPPGHVCSNEGVIQRYLGKTMSLGGGNNA